MQPNDLRSVPGARREKHHPDRGTGSGPGKTGGCGHKGLTPRFDGKAVPGFKDDQQLLHRRLPKFGFASLKAMDRAEVRTFKLVKVEGGVVSLQTLKDANLIDQHVQRVEAVLFGEVGRAVILRGAVTIKDARTAIETVGGKFED